MQLESEAYSAKPCYLFVPGVAILNAPRFEQDQE